MTKLDDQAVVEGFRDSLYEDYKKSFGKLFANCMYALPADVEVHAQAYKVNKPDLIIRACREVLETYENGMNTIPNPDQMTLFNMQEARNG